LREQRFAVTILWRSSATNPFNRYIVEILQEEGYPQARVVDLAVVALDERILAESAAVLVAEGARCDAAALELLREYVTAGGALLAFRPAAPLAELLGAEAAGCASPARYVSVRPEHPLARHCSASRVQLHGPAGVYRPHGAEVLAYLSSGRKPLVLQAAVATHRVGAGRAVLFAYDVGLCVVRFQQGRARYGSLGKVPDPDGDGFAKMTHFYMQQLDTELKMVPQADVHKDLLVHCLRWATEGSPLPRLWYYPNAEPCLVWLNGDSDGMAGEDMDRVLATVERYRGRYTLYVMRNDYSALEPEREAQLRGKGHSFGQHVWCAPNPGPEEWRARVQDEFAAFRRRYGHGPLTHRGHCVVWVGWVASARILAEQGVHFDLDCIGYRHLREGYINGSGRPARFVDEGGELIDLFEQATQWSDDTCFIDKTFLPPFDLASAARGVTAMIDAAARRYHTVVNVLVHPIHTRTRTDAIPALAWLEAIASECARRGVRMVGGDEWALFHRGRRGVRFLEWGLEAPRDERSAPAWRAVLLAEAGGVRGLTVLWPTGGAPSAHGSSGPAGRGRWCAAWDGKPHPVAVRRFGGLLWLVAVVDLDEGRAAELRIWRSADAGGKHLPGPPSGGKPRGRGAAATGRLRP
jgi:hypothetical protein